MHVAALHVAALHCRAADDNEAEHQHELRSHSGNCSASARRTCE
jgi:hypothetical protein